MKIELKILAACLMMCQMALAFNFGSYARTDNVTISGGSAVFEVLLWTSDSYNVSVRLYADSKPAGWNVAINPETLSINNNTGSEIMILNVSNFRKASLIRITATPGSYAVGDYDIKIIAEAKASSVGMASAQQRTFNMHAKLLPLPTTTIQPGSQSSPGAFFPSQNRTNKTATSIQGGPGNTSSQASQSSALFQDQENSKESQGAPTGMLISGAASDVLILFIFVVSIIILVACAIKIIKRIRGDY
jgi:hypothetical protein